VNYFEYSCSPPLAQENDCRNQRGFGCDHYYFYNGRAPGGHKYHTESLRFHVSDKTYTEIQTENVSVWAIDRPKPSTDRFDYDHGIALEA